MRNYWSCTKFADWVRGTPKPAAATMEEWESWRKEAKRTHKFRHWIAETLLDNIQTVVYSPHTLLVNIRYYINNRWVSRSHALTANRNDIKPGEWCDLGRRFLPCMFNELVDFVEIEQAWHHCMWDKAAREKYMTPWWRSGWLRWRTWRCPESGIEYLTWASALVYSEDWGFNPGDPQYGTPTKQAQDAREILALYNWWKNIRPARPDVYEHTGWTDFCAKTFTDDGEGFREPRTDKEREESRRILGEMNKMEEQYEREDEEMMFRLIRVRHSLWT